MLLTPQAMIFMVVGVIYGIVIGILPGLGGIVAMALLLPITYGMDVASALALLIGSHVSTIWGGSVTSILFRVPGNAKNVAQMFDGYPMTQRGEASRALGASATAALLGGVIGAVFLVISVPIVRPVMMALGPAEILMMALWGLTVIAAFSDGSLLKGLVGATLGLLAAFIGMDMVTGTPRFTFGSQYLFDGISFPVAMIGLFAIAEMMKLYAKGESMVKRDVNAQTSSVWDGVRDCFTHWGLIVRSSILGLWIGVLPGVGGSVGSIAAYAHALKTSKHPETFGKGNVEGLIAPDATLGANEGGGLLPTLALGIPGGEGMAILLIAFIGIGIVPGPTMLTDHLDIVFGFAWIIVVASVLTSLIGLAISPWLARVPSLHNDIIIPLVLAICLLGAYADRGQPSDVVVAIGFGIIGYVMEKYHYSRATFVVGMVLAIMIERNLHISVSLYGPWFIFLRPVALVMFILIVFTTVWPFVQNWRKGRHTQPETVTETRSVP
jgi:TctA family transporter